MGARIRAGHVSQLNKDSGDWIFVDIGFSSTGSSCGVLKNCGEPRTMKFGELVDYLSGKVGEDSLPLNLMIEAPLSVAFRENGNPVGRAGEKRGSEHRYWYNQAGARVLLAAGFLMRKLFDCERQREVRLFEGFASFKSSTDGGSHKEDTKRLRLAAWNRTKHQVIDRSELKTSDAHVLECAFTFAGMDFDIPPVVFACDHADGDPNCLQ